MSARRRKADHRLELQGSLWITVAGENLGGRERIDLLRAVADQGSITHAAKAHGISYKAAWDAIDAMNTLAGEPLVERSTGGRGGGSTRLTARGQRLVERFEQIDAAHQRFLKLLDEQSIDLEQPFSLLRVLNMKTSARNQFVGTVTALRSGAVNDEVEITLPSGVRIVAVVTQESVQSLGLRTKMTAIALVKSSSIVVATDLEGAKVSARNQLAGTVSAVTPGAVNAEIVLDLDGGGSIAAIVTEGSAKSLGLAPGKRAIALFKASSVILAVTA
jgi:molybdate transport system regulatory protein